MKYKWKNKTSVFSRVFNSEVIKLSPSSELECLYWKVDSKMMSLCFCFQRSISNLFLNKLIESKLNSNWLNQTFWWPTVLKNLHKRCKFSEKICSWDGALSYPAWLWESFFNAILAAFQGVIPLSLFKNGPH